MIGRVGFRHDFRATADLAGPGADNCRTIKEGARPDPPKPYPGRPTNTMQMHWA